MTNEIVKYGNQLNAVPFRNFKPTEMNLFFSIVSRMRDKGTRKVTFTFDELKELSNFSRNGDNKNSFFEVAKKTYGKMLGLNMFNESDGEFHAWVLFTDFVVSQRQQSVTISVNPELQPVLNKIINWTRFGLKEFVDLRSSYSKTMFRLLKQYRTKGERYYPIEEFRYLLDIPNSYRASTIDDRVLKPIKEELSPIFAGFKCQKIYKESKIKKGKKKKSGGKGLKILGYKFTWKPEDPNKDDFKQLFDEQYKIDNVKNNPELNSSEKKHAIDKLLKLPLGTTKDLDVPTLTMLKMAGIEFEKSKSRVKKRRDAKEHHVLETLPDWAKDKSDKLQNKKANKNIMPWERY